MRVEDGRLRRGALLGMLLLTLAPAPACGVPIQVVANQNFSAYVPLFAELFENAGLPVEIKLYPADRSRQMLVGGTADAEFFRTKAAAGSLPAKATFIGPVACLELAAFVKADSEITLRGPSDLSKFKVGYFQGNQSARDFAKSYSTDAQTATKTENLMRMLDAGRFDIAIEHSATGIRMTNALGLRGRIKLLQPLLKVEPTYLVLANDRYPWQAQLERSLLAMKQSGHWLQRFGEIGEANGLPKQTSLHCLLDPN